MRPRVIIFDESTAMLDPIGRKAVIEIMEKLNREENITVINITHYMEEAARADRVIVINDGQMIIDGAPKEVFAEVDLLHRIGLESPQSTELVSKLKSAGIDVDLYAIGEDECVNTILHALTEGNSKYE
jgi:energy-coupling factor transport system ATP-binding protein